LRNENIHRTIKDKRHWCNWSHQHSDTKNSKNTSYQCNSHSHTTCL